jgi:hypothetical protein
MLLQAHGKQLSGLEELTCAAPPQVDSVRPGSGWCRSVRWRRAPAGSLGRCFRPLGAVCAWQDQLRQHCVPAPLWSPGLVVCRGSAGAPAVAGRCCRELWPHGLDSDMSKTGRSSGAKDVCLACYGVDDVSKRAADLWAVARDAHRRRRMRICTHLSRWEQSGEPDLRECGERGCFTGSAVWYAL